MADTRKLILKQSKNPVDNFTADLEESGDAFTNTIKNNGSKPMKKGKI